jgi:hypothetical protein
LASDQSNPTQGLLMPKLKYRFRVIFENLGVSTPRTELTKQVMDFTRPNLSFQEMEIPIYNSRIYLAGKHEWQPVTCNLRDDAGGQVAKLVGEQLQKQMDFVEMASAASGIDYKFITRCEILDGGNGASTPTVLETWELYGCYLASVDYGNLDYSASEPVTMALSLRFDNAIQTPIGDGIGATVGRTVGDVVTG